MNPPRRVPQSLKIVAYLFMIEGFLWMSSMVVSAVEGKLWFNPLIFVALIGWGLLKVNFRSYLWAQAFIWFELVLSSCLVFLCWWLITFYNQPVRDFIVILILCGLMIALKLGQLWVLLSPPVHRAFSLPDEG